ncbi:MFS transporter [Streptomyces roseoverticillatus]|uniref:MFS transporter n=1 Tax=Streptomyces roseoverticillatus TaxID=66429 RepID=UPI001F30680A|nr:MFS transporter [Streptomyces roseoverticillatus]MCF3103031.1 MFS transporter [Streptomyces roseoverticillatus]
MYRSLIVLAAGMFAIGTDSFVIAGILPDAADSLGIPVGTAGWLITTYAFTYAVLGPVMAALTTRWPRRALFLTGFAIFIAGNLITAFVPVFGVALAARALAGLGGAMVTPAAVAAAAALAPPERRGRAIATVMTGLSAATALGAPIGTAIGSLTGNWRATMVFVSALGILAAVGIALLLPTLPTPPAVPLRTRVAPLADRRIGLTLLTTFLVYTGLYTVYSFVGVSLDRATDGSGTTLAALLFVWGLAATAGTLGSGGLIDRFGSRRVINIAITMAAIDFALLPWTSAHLPSTIAALIVWGVCGWGMLTPQTHRLITAMPAAAPLLTGLASAMVYVGVSVAPLVGQVSMAWFGPHLLGPVGALFIALGLGAAEAAHTVIRRRAPQHTPTEQAQPSPAK